MVTNKLLSIIKFKSNLHSYKYLFFYISLLSTPDVIKNLSKKLKLLNFKYQIIKKLKFDVIKNLHNLDKFFINGPYFLIYSNDLNINLNIDNNLCLLLLSYKNYFVNNNFFINLIDYERLFNNNLYIIYIYIYYFVNIYFLIINYFKLIIVLQLNLYYKIIINSVNSFNIEDFNKINFLNNIC